MARPTGRSEVVREQFVTTGDTTVCFDVRGPADGPTVVLIMGLGLDLLWWREEFCDDLVRRGLRVVRFDNRDVGRSTSFTGPGPSPVQLLTRRAPVSYTLEDMADDTAGLIRHVAPAGAHVVGVSLGALIAQATTVGHGGLVRSLVSIMGRPGDGRSGRMARRILLEWFRPAPADPIEGMIATFGRIGSSGRTEADDADVRAIMARAATRAIGDGSGGGRQLAAILAERDRTVGLRGYDRPALVIHGSRDRVILPSGGRVTAAALPQAELLLIEGMGHDLARRFWPVVLDGIERTVRRAGPDLGARRKA